MQMREERSACHMALQSKVLLQRGAGVNYERGVTERASLSSFVSAEEMLPRGVVLPHWAPNTPTLFLLARRARRGKLENSWDLAASGRSWLAAARLSRADAA